MDCLKVNFCAAPSSRKSTVCAALESLLKQQKINADTSKEYARQFIQQYGVPKDIASQFIIYNNQKARDEGVAAVSEVLLTDTPAMNCYVFGKRSLNERMKREGRTSLTKEEYKILEELHGMALKKLNWFDIIFVFPPTDPVVNDGTRTETMDDKVAIYNAIKGFLDVEGVPYHIIDGSVEYRIDACMGIILDELSKRKKVG